eukprot:SAG11_NODE_239_length_11783_cov_52.724923_6_plen_78_part_00
MTPVEQRSLRLGAFLLPRSRSGYTDRYPPVLRYLSTQVLDLETIQHFSNTKFSPFSNVYIGDMSLPKLSHDECYFNI